jgi:tetratricopeptide (TPR) repeat protein
MHNNLGMALKNFEGAKPLKAKGEFSKAIELNPEYAKALYHRMNLHKDDEEYDLALADANRILEIDPDFDKPYLKGSIIPKLEQLQKEKFEKMKDEVIGNMKNLGNKALGYFGMSMDNFKMQQNPDGTYNINY